MAKKKQTAGKEAPEKAKKAPVKAKKKAPAKAKKTSAPLKKAPVKTKKAPKAAKETPSASKKTPQQTKKTYSVSEFSKMTYLTVNGVNKWLKEGKLNGEKDENGNWLVDAASLNLPNMKRLIR